MEYQNILVPVSGTDIDEEAIRLACRLAKADKAKIWVVYVIPIQRTLPLDAEIEAEVQKAEEILDRMERVARGDNYVIETDLLQAREAGPTIVDEAIEREVDLILMGVSYKRRFGQFSLGSVVPYVLKNAPCRVILYHQYTPPTEDET
ncbi:MAG: universal stress protein [Dehalococcoidales bacterium]|nr:MAG: universal stress protein [Dehalococcoidales bacterium]